MAQELAKGPCQRHCWNQMLRRIQSRTGLWYRVMGTAKITLDRFKNKLKQGGHILSCTVPKVSHHQRHIFVVGRFNLGLQGFHGFTWKSGLIQGREDGDKGQLHEQWGWFPHPSGLLRATGSHHSPLVPLHAHTHLMCRLGLIWAHKNQESFPKPVRLPPNLPS